MTNKVDLRKRPSQAAGWMREQALVFMRAHPHLRIWVIGGDHWLNHVKVRPDALQEMFAKQELEPDQAKAPKMAYKLTAEVVSAGN